MLCRTSLMAHNCRGACERLTAENEDPSRLPDVIQGDQRLHEGHLALAARLAAIRRMDGDEWMTAACCTFRVFIDQGCEEGATRASMVSSTLFVVDLVLRHWVSFEGSIGVDASDPVCTRAKAASVRLQPRLEALK